MAERTITQDDRFRVAWAGIDVDVVCHGFECESLVRALLSPPFEVGRWGSSAAALMLDVRCTQLVDSMPRQQAPSEPLLFEVQYRTADAIKVAGTSWDPSLGTFLLTSHRSACEWNVGISTTLPLAVRWVAELIKLFASTSIQAAGSRFMHCSAVGTADGNALLFAGESGSGKTTTALLACMRAGARLISDELTVLMPSEGAPDVCCWPGSVGVSTETERLTGRYMDPAFQSRRVGLTAPDLLVSGKRSLDWDEYLALMRIPIRSRAPLRATILLRLRPTPGWRISVAEPERAHALLRTVWRNSTEVPWLFDPIGLLDYPVGPAIGPEVISARPVLEVEVGPRTATEFQPFWDELLAQTTTA